MGIPETTSQKVKVVEGSSTLKPSFWWSEGQTGEGGIIDRGTNGEAEMTKPVFRDKPGTCS